MVLHAFILIILAKCFTNMNAKIANFGVPRNLFLSRQRAEGAAQFLPVLALTLGLPMNMGALASRRRVHCKSCADETLALPATVVL
jgi:hypothetical protein